MDLGCLVLVLERNILTPSLQACGDLRAPCNVYSWRHQKGEGLFSMGRRYRLLEMMD